MGLTIIYGKSGTGKSTYIFKEIAKKIEEESKRKIYIITPEQFSFTAEKKLLEALSNKAVISAEVLTFNRMAYRIINASRRANFEMLSSCGKSMLLYDILSEKKSDLKFIGKSSENVEVLVNQITEFKKHGITVDNLKQAISDTEDEYLSYKLKDMLEVYETYEQTIENKCIDENDTLSILANNLENSDEFKNCDIYIDEFIGFTKQEYDILRILLRNQNNIYLTVCIDNLELSKTPDTDVFSVNKQTLNKIVEIAKEENISVEYLNSFDKLYRFNNAELIHLEENICKLPYQKYVKDVENIELFLANNAYSEIEHIAQKIIMLIRDKKYRYNEISVITKNIEQYGSLCRAIFNSYNIPVYIDEKKDFSQNVLVKYILSILHIFANNWSYEAVFEYIKTGFLDIDEMDIHVLENYCLKWGIKGSKWYQGDWNFYDETEEEKEKILHIKEKVVPNLVEFKNKLTGTKNVSLISKTLYEFLVENDIRSKFETKIQDLREIGQNERAQEYETSWKIIMELLDEIVFVLKDKKVSFEKYADILKIGLSARNLGTIPSTQDQVTVGDVDRSRSHDVKAVFMIGLNDGSFPNVNKNEGFFNDTDREKLKENSLELAKGTTEKIYDDNFNIYKAFSTAKEKLYLSYVSSDLEGKSLRASIFIHRIKKIFPNLKEESEIIKKQDNIITKQESFENLLDTIRKISEGEEIAKEDVAFFMELYTYFLNDEQWKEKLNNSLKALQEEKNISAVSKKWIEKLYGDTLKTSISRLEQYKSCPFSYYLKYGLNLSEKNEFKIEAIDTGTFMHDVIDEFFAYLEENSILINEIDDKQIQDIVDKIVTEKLDLKKNYIFTAIPKYRILASRLKKVVKQSMKYIVDSLKYSKFEVLGHEIEFKEGKNYPPIQIELEDGKKVEITGKIDRLDIAKTPEGNYLRIIDYKSSVKDINLNEVVAGLQLQLLTYLDAVCEKGNALPAGVLYFNLIEPLIKTDKHLTEEEIEAEIRKQFKMKGLILADIDIVKKMDTSLEKGSSNIVPAYIDKEGKLSVKSNTVSREEFETLQKHTKKMLKEIGKQILSGDISAKPYYKIKGGKTPCEYCSYKSMCNFHHGICKNNYFYIGNSSNEEILNKLLEK